MSRTPTPESFLEDYPPEIRKLAVRLQILVLSVEPATMISVRAGWKLIGFDIPAEQSNRYMGYVAPFEDHVRLGFEYGAWIRNFDDLLEGDGDQVRYVRLQPGDTIDSGRLTELIKLGTQLARQPKELLESLERKEEG